MTTDDTQQRMELAEQAGKRGDWRKAADLYERLGKSLAAQLGPHHPQVLDAYEGAVRWIEEAATWPPERR